jgi:metallophosphoesterase superfamily enzyme
MNAPLPRLSPQPDKIIRLHGHAFVADPSGALFWPDERMLIVADLHLEKGSAHAARRVFLPPYDTAATLAALAAAVARFAPRRVVALNLRALQAGRDWIWIAGNHDPAAPSGLPGEHHAALEIGGIALRHEPTAGLGMGEIAGHLHPVARVASRTGTLRRRCFACDGARLIMPAFGAYAGGLNVLDPAFAALFGARERHAHVLGRDAVHTVSPRQCLPETTGFWR